MASISSLSSSSTSSIYGNRNVLSGLASGLDTESMIENSVKGYKLKLSSLQQQRTKVEWKQSAYRSIINKMASFTQKYTSYTSGTNLLSASFFNSATKITTQGKYADKVSATGKSSSTVKINSVKSLATAARYSVGAGNLKASNETSKPFNLTNKDQTVGKLNGSLNLTYGKKNIRLNFDENDLITDASALAEAINKKLEDQKITFDNGDSAKASERIKAVAESNGTIRFTEVGTSNGVKISGASGTIGTEVGIKIPADEKEKDTYNFFKYTGGDQTEKKSLGELIAEKGFTITVDGKSKTIKWGEGESIDNAAELIKDINDKIAADPDLAGKLEVKNIGDADNIKLQFNDKQTGTNFEVTSALGEELGMEGGLTSYVNTKRALKDVVKDGTNWGGAVTTDKALTLSDDGKYYVDEDGNRFVKGENGDTNYYKVNKDGEKLYNFRINKVDIEVSQEDTLEDLMNAVNNNKDAGVTMAYSKFTGKFTFTAKATGANGKVELGIGMAETMFYSDVEKTESAKALIGAENLADGNLAEKTFAFKVEGVDKPLSFDFAGEGGKLSDVIGRVNAALRENDTAKDKGLTATGFGKDGSLIIKDKNGDLVEATMENDIAKKLQEGIEKNNGLAVTRIKGEDAVFNVTVNGETKNVSQGSNTINIDGMSVTLKNTFTAEKGDEVTFSTSADADKIVSAVKTMVEDYNAMVTEIKKAYSTIPLTNSKGKYYEPLTDEDQADMSETAIKNYEEKAKTGLLFGDRDLSNLYSGLTNALNVLGITGNDAQKLGLTTSFEDGTTTLALDESALREALANDPDKVKDVFTRTTKSGASSDGLMQGLKNQLDRYAATTGADKGILVKKAGSSLAPTSIYDNTLQKELDNFDKQITKWQDKLSDQIDYYNSKFTALEQMIAQMNNQSSMLMGLSGGY